VVEYVYNANGQVTSEIRYATLVDTTSWYNGTSVTKTLVSQIRPSTTANDRSTQYSYDNANRLAMSVNPGGIATVYTYDGNDRLLQTQTMDRVTRFFYDKDGHHVGLLDAEGYLTENVYNSAGHLVNVRRYAPLTSAALRATGTLADLRPSITGRLDTWNFYDPAGRLIGVLDDKQFLTQYTYDEANNQRKEIRYGPAYTSTVTTATPFSTVQGAVAATGNFSTTVTDYDGMGRVLKVTNKEGTITQNEYDAAGRLVRSTVADATAEARTTRLRYNAFGELTGKITGEDADLVTVGMTGAQIADIFAQHGLRYVYDVSGRQARVTDTAGNTSVYFYDAANRLTTVINGAGEVREMVYNTFGEQSEAASLSNRLSSSDRGDLASNGGGLLTQQVKDLVAAIRDVSKDSRTQYSYNMRGLLASKTDAEGYVSSYGYTSFGELDTETRTLSLSPSSTVATKYTYNKRSELLSTTIDATGLNIVRSQTYDAFGRLLTQTDATGMVTSTAYSNAGRIIAV
jgi:YD repeat-containing protein